MNLFDTGNRWLTLVVWLVILFAVLMVWVANPLVGAIVTVVLLAVYLLREPQGDPRREVFSRLAALLWSFTFGWVIVTAFTVIALVVTVFDLLWQWITGSPGLDPQGWLGSYVSDVFYWSVVQTVYGFTGGGDGRFRLLWTV